MKPTILLILDGQTHAQINFTMQKNTLSSVLQACRLVQDEPSLTTVGACCTIASQLFATAPNDDMHRGAQWRPVSMCVSFGLDQLDEVDGWVTLSFKIPSYGWWYHGDYPAVAVDLEWTFWRNNQGQLNQTTVFERLFEVKKALLMYRHSLVLHHVHAQQPQDWPIPVRNHPFDKQRF